MRGWKHAGRRVYNDKMFYVEIFLLLIFTVLCAILLALWGIRQQLERITGHDGQLVATPTAAKPPAS
jgi:hypothetical protein